MGKIGNSAPTVFLDKPTLIIIIIIILFLMTRNFTKGSSNPLLGSKF